MSNEPVSSQTLETITLLGRLRGTKRLWVFICAALLGVALLAAQMVGLKRELSANDLGFDIQRTASGRSCLIGSMAPGWEGLKVGDRLLAIGGRPVTADSFFDARRVLPVGPVTVTVERDAQRFDVTGSVGPPSVHYQLAVALRWVAGLTLWLVGAGVFLLRPGAKVSWVFFFFDLAVTPLVAVTIAFPADMSLYLPFLFSLFPIAGVLAMHFFTMFPRTDWFSRLVVPSYVVASLLMVVRLGLWFSVPDAGERFVAFDVVSRLCGAAFGLPAIIALVKGWVLGHQTKDRVLMTVSRTLTFAAALGLVAPVVVNALVRALHLDGSIAHQASAAFVLIFTLLTASVLVRYNPLEIDRYAASVAGYVVTLGGLGGIFLLVLVTVPFAAKATGLASSTEVLVGLTAVIFLSVGPLSRRMRKVIDRWFARVNTDALQTADVLRKVSDVVQRERVTVALQAVVDAAMVVGPELVAMWQLEPTGQRLERTVWKNGPIERAVVPRTSAARVVIERAGGVAGLAPTTLPIEAQQLLWELGLAMSSPVRTRGVAVGFIGVGRRSSGFGYRTEDQAFLDMLASQAGLALDRGEVVTQVGRYRLERRLGAGGMAEVFLAWQLGPGGFERKVALKRLLPELAEDSRSSAILLDEARITSRLNHPNIAHVYEVGIEAGAPFIAMELIDGPPLRTLISAMVKSQQHVPLGVGLAIARALLGALEHAHALKDENGVPLRVVHRDVTPANVLVSTTGETKLVDFGLVLATTRIYRTQTGVARGTLPYMSPEQLRHDELDLRSDVYSAGATLYELFCRVRAFPGGPTMLRPEPISSMAALPSTMDAVFERAMAKDAAVRFDDAAKFWAALSAACPGAAVASDAEVAVWVRSLMQLWAPDRPQPAETTQPQAPNVNTKTLDLKR